MPGDEIGGELLRSEKKRKKKPNCWRECLLLVLAVVRARRREDAPGGGVLGVGCARDDDPTSRPRGRSRVPRGFVAIPRWGDDHPGLGGCPSLRGVPGRRGGGARDAGGDANAPPARGGEEEDHHEVRHRDAAPIPRLRRPSPRPQPRSPFPIRFKSPTPASAHPPPAFDSNRAGRCTTRTRPGLSSCAPPRRRRRSPPATTTPAWRSSSTLSWRRSSGRTSARACAGCGAHFTASPPLGPGPGATKKPSLLARSPGASWRTTWVSVSPSNLSRWGGRCVG